GSKKMYGPDGPGDSLPNLYTQHFCTELRPRRVPALLEQARRDPPRGRVLATGAHDPGGPRPPPPARGREPARTQRGGRNAVREPPTRPRRHAGRRSSATT